MKPYFGYFATVVLLTLGCQSANVRRIPPAAELPVVKVDLRSFDCDNEWAYQLEGRHIEVIGFLHPEPYVHCRSSQPGGCSMSLRTAPRPDLHTKVDDLRIYVLEGNGPNQVIIPGAKFTAAQVTFHDQNGQPLKYTKKVLIRAVYRHNPYGGPDNACELELPVIKQL